MRRGNHYYCINKIQKKLSRRGAVTTNLNMKPPANARGVWSSFPIPHVHAYSHTVPHKQLLAVVGGVLMCGLPLVPSIPVSCHSCAQTTHVAPISTPRASAHGSGWGCFMGWVFPLLWLSPHPHPSTL